MEIKLKNYKSLISHFGQFFAETIFICEEVSVVVQLGWHQSRFDCVHVQRFEEVVAQDVLGARAFALGESEHLAADLDQISKAWVLSQMAPVRQQPLLKGKSARLWRLHASWNLTAILNNLPQMRGLGMLKSNIKSELVESVGLQGLADHLKGVIVVAAIE